MKKRLFANFRWKALSLAVAITLWYLVVGQPEVVTSQSAPVFYRNLGRNLEIASDAPDRVRLELRGPEGRLSSDTLARTAVFLDLSQIREPGERTFTIDTGDISVPSGVKLVRAVPSQLRLMIERMLSKEVPVQVRTRPGASMRVLRQEARPARLPISGPEGRVRQLESAQTDPIDLSRVVDGEPLTVHAYLSDPQVRFEAPAVVTVRLWLERPPTQ